MVSINAISNTTPVIPKVEELKEIIKFFDGRVRDTYWMFIVYTLHTCRISLRKREQVLKKFRFSDQEIAMNFI
jgi:hypothetical protein